MKNFVKFTALAAAVTLGPIAPQAFAAKPEIYTKGADKLAVSGYDVVSYFSGKPIVGDAKFTTVYKGANFRFANAANLAKFKANPVAFAPQYGGYCAYAVAKGQYASADPLAAKLVNGKLYLNYSASIKKKWEAGQDKYITSADVNWPKLTSGAVKAGATEDYGSQ